MSLEQAQPKHLHGASWRIAAERLRMMGALVSGRQGEAWWRARWYYDARSAGLAVFAERGLLPNRDFTANDRVREVVPALVELLVLSHSRLYLVRPLPSQTLETFETATRALVLRWKADSVTASLHPVRRGLIVLDVVTGASIDGATTYPGA